MLGIFFRIFDRYADATLSLSLPPVNVRGGFARAELQRNRLIVVGQTDAARVGLRLLGSDTWVETEPFDAARQFRFDLPFVALSAEVLLDGEAPKTLPGFSPIKLLLARAALLPGFCIRLLRHSADLWRWKVRRDFGAREKIKQMLGLVPAQQNLQLDAALFVPADQTAVPQFDRVTVVMPVYNAFDLLIEALRRAEDGADLPLRFILIEDASSDDRVRPWLKDWVAQPGREAQLLCHDQNQGFVAAVNRGLAQTRRYGGPVVLLNSDAFVPPGWTSRLIAPLVDPDVASVTPMSNDAELMSVPVICSRNDLATGLAEAIDAVARELNPVAAKSCDLPTGVGFCMALSARFLDLVPEFDVAFGRGYGEEVDWCQRTRALGGRHVAQPALFVEHRGGSSFGTVEKQALLARNGAEISRRYPRFDREVQAFLDSDPLVTARLVLGLGWAAARASKAQPVTVWMGHALGGGAENDLKRRLALDGGGVVVRVGHHRRFQVELHTPYGVTQAQTSDLGLVRRLVGLLPDRRVIYSCGVGDRNPVELPDILLALAGRGPNAVPGGAQPLEILVHDFFLISPAYTLLGADGAFHWPLNPQDPAHQTRQPDGAVVSLADWQTAWGALVAQANRVCVFSQSSHDLVQATYPGAALAVVPHRPLGEIPQLKAAVGPTPVIGVLGNIGLHKGAGVLVALSQVLAQDRHSGLVVLGDLDPRFRLASPAKVHGSYRLDDLPGLVSRYGISAWFIPSIWPETFSFTTHEALATGLPVYCFDIGAQADALHVAMAKGAPGAVLPLTLGAQDLARALGGQTLSQP